jgi:hypothetical protein
MKSRDNANLSLLCCVSVVAGMYQNMKAKREYGKKKRREK